MGSLDFIQLSNHERDKMLLEYIDACLGMTPSEVVKWRRELWTETVMRTAQDQDFAEKMLKLLDVEQGETEDN